MIQLFYQSNVKALRIQEVLLLTNNIKKSQTLQMSHKVKRNLEHQIHLITRQPEIYAHSPLDFSRNRKLSFETTIKIILSFGGQSLSSELLSYFDYTLRTPTASAFVQARSKINIEAFEQLFYQTVPSSNQHKQYKGYQILAHDGSDINIPYDENDPESHYTIGKFGKHVGSFHLNALYDPINKYYASVDFQKIRQLDERSSLCQMVDEFTFEKPTIIIADRGYESFNVYEHIKKSGQKFVIRVKDTKSNGFLKGLGLSRSETFDKEINLRLTRRQTNKIKSDKNYHFLHKKTHFDYLPPNSKESYPFSLRVVRIKLSENSYESLVTNLDPFNFKSEDLKVLYHLRWGIETSFRELKYALGLNQFHSKKLEFIIQEIYARLIMYNFSMEIALAVALSDPIKQSYQLNFTQAIGICKRFFLDQYVNAEILIRRYLLPIRPNRSDQRNITKKKFTGFLYRIA